MGRGQRGQRDRQPCGLQPRLRLVTGNPVLFSSLRVLSKLASHPVPARDLPQLPPGMCCGTRRSQLIRWLDETIALRTGGAAVPEGGTHCCARGRAALRGGRARAAAGAERSPAPAGGRRRRTELRVPARRLSAPLPAPSAGCGRAPPRPPLRLLPSGAARLQLTGLESRPGAARPPPAAAPRPGPTMGDAGSERSKAPSLPPRCPCGFWGSSKTMNLCSKCFAEKRNPHNEKDFQKKQPDDDSTPSTSNSQSDLFSGETNSDNSNTSLTTQAANSNQQLLTELNVTSPSKEECGPCTGTAHASLTTPTKRSCDSDSQSESEASPVKRPRLLDDSNDRPEETRSKQKSRRRCFQCQTKLELVQQELGSCRCGYVFCMLHRLPEQHDCTFDHMGRGREEAIMKMVKLDRKVGRSCQRIGEGCS
ncbi:LOW QUALITY PROTEIN: AN1-type zinc finger protein 3 [Chamaea fasciata]